MSIRLLSLLTFVPLLCPAENTISFDKDIQPILQNNCLKCHGAKIQLAKLDLRTRESAAHVLAGKADQSSASKLKAEILDDFFREDR